MTTRLRCKVYGIALTLGGLIAGISHLFDSESFAEPGRLVQCAYSPGPLHLLIFLSLTVVFLGWSGLHSLQGSDAGVIESASFVFLFTGILCADFLHCVLEFSVFPVLGSTVPYALPGIAEATYHSATLESLMWAGRYLIFLGSIATAWSIYRRRLLPRWAAAPFALSAALTGLEVFPQFAPAFQPVAISVFYFSITVLGVSHVTGPLATQEVFAEPAID